MSFPDTGECRGVTLGRPGPALHLRASKCCPSSPRLQPPSAVPRPLACDSRKIRAGTHWGGVGAVRGAFEVSDLVSPACHQQGHTAGPQRWPRLRLAPCLGPGVVSGALYGEGALRGLGSLWTSLGPSVGPALLNLAEPGWGRSPFPRKGGPGCPWPETCRRPHPLLGGEQPHSQARPLAGDPRQP